MVVVPNYTSPPCNDPPSKGSRPWSTENFPLRGGGWDSPEKIGKASEPSSKVVGFYMPYLLCFGIKNTWQAGKCSGSFCFIFQKTILSFMGFSRFRRARLVKCVLNITLLGGRKKWWVNHPPVWKQWCWNTHLGYKKDARDIKQGTKMTLVLIGNGLVLEGWPSRIEFSWVLGTYSFT